MNRCEAPPNISVKVHASGEAQLAVCFFKPELYNLFLIYSCITVVFNVHFHPNDCSSLDRLLPPNFRMQHALEQPT